MSLSSVLTGPVKADKEETGSETSAPSKRELTANGVVVPWKCIVPFEMEIKCVRRVKLIPKTKLLEADSVTELCCRIHPYEVTMDNRTDVQVQCPLLVAL